MKIRLDYVTNSSSSSYIVMYKIQADDNTIEAKIKEEFGNYGLDFWNDDIYTGKQILDIIYESIDEDDQDLTAKIHAFIETDTEDIDEIADELEEVEIGNEYIHSGALSRILLAIKANPDQSFLIGSRIKYTTEGDQDSENLFIVDEICPTCNIKYEEF